MKCPSQAHVLNLWSLNGGQSGRFWKL
jgi:hypothetical protein